MNFTNQEPFVLSEREKSDIDTLLSISQDVPEDISRRKRNREVDFWSNSKHFINGGIGAIFSSTQEKINRDVGLNLINEKALLEQAQHNFDEAQTYLVECLRDIDIKLSVLDLLLDERFKSIASRMETMDKATYYLRELIIEFFEIKLKVLQTRNKLANLKGSKKDSSSFGNLQKFSLEFYNFNTIVCKTREKWERAYLDFEKFKDKTASKNCDEIAKELFDLISKKKESLLNFD